MSVQALSWAMAQTTGSGTRKAVLLALANCQNHHTGQCNPKVATLAAELELNESTVRRAIWALQDAGLVKPVELRRKDGSQKPTQYVLAMDDQTCTEQEQTGTKQVWQTGTEPVLREEPEVDLEPSVETYVSTARELSTQNGFHVETASAQALVKHFVDEARAAEVPMPRRVIGHLARSVGELLAEGHSPPQVWAGMLRMVERRIIQPSLLANFVTEAAIPKQPTRRYGYGVQSSEIRADDPDLFGPGNEYMEQP